MRQDEGNLETADVWVIVRRDTAVIGEGETATKKALVF